MVNRATRRKGCDNARVGQLLFECLRACEAQHCLHTQTMYVFIFQPALLFLWRLILSLSRTSARATEYKTKTHPGWQQSSRQTNRTILLEWNAYNRAKNNTNSYQTRTHAHKSLRLHLPTLSPPKFRLNAQIPSHLHPPTPTG